LEEHKKLYEEALVKEIMVSTALCIQELVQDDKTINEDDICQFLDENYRSIIEETLAGEIDQEEDSDEDPDEDWKKGID